MWTGCKYYNLITRGINLSRKIKWTQARETSWIASPRRFATRTSLSISSRRSRMTISRVTRSRSWSRLRSIERWLFLVAGRSRFSCSRLTGKRRKNWWATRKPRSTNSRWRNKPWTRECKKSTTTKSKEQPKSNKIRDSGLSKCTKTTSIWHKRDNWTSSSSTSGTNWTRMTSWSRGSRTNRASSDERAPLSAPQDQSRWSIKRAAQTSYLYWLVDEYNKSR